jgi:hypothetical protein
MTGHNIKQTVFMLIGLLAGLWVGNYFWHSVARYGGEKLVKKVYGDRVVDTHPESYKSEVDKATLMYEEKFSEHTIDNLWGILITYGIPSVVGIAIGSWIAGPSGPASEKVVYVTSPPGAAATG